MDAVLNDKQLLIKGLGTHVVVETLCKDLRDLLLSKDLSLYFFFEGSPKPLGEGISIKLIFSRELSESEINTLRKFFEVRGINFRKE